LTADALGAAQNNVSLALSCVQAQLWMKSTVAAIIREVEEGTLLKFERLFGIMELNLKRNSSPDGT